jgi:hypothetical protein
MQVQIGGGDRRVAHPRLNRGWVDAAGQPQTSRGVPEVVDPSPVGDRRPTESPLERGGVQLVARRCGAQQGVLHPALDEFADDR